MILSKEANAWGHFSYNQAEDALRFTATPVPGEMTERLEYTFDDPKADARDGDAALGEAGAAVPVSVNSTQVVMDSLQQQLRGLPQVLPRCLAAGVGLGAATTTSSPRRAPGPTRRSGSAPRTGT